MPQILTSPIGHRPRASLRGRITCKLRRWIEPGATRVLHWCNSPEPQPTHNDLLNLLNLLTAAERRLGETEDRARNLEGRVDRAEWGREAIVEQLNAQEDKREAIVERMNAQDARKEAIVERMNAQDVLIEQNANLVATFEPMVHNAFWGREALVDRFNEADGRTIDMDKRSKAMQEQIDEYVIRPLALELDALALSRRLAMIEDRLDALLTRMESAQPSG